MLTMLKEKVQEVISDKLGASMITENAVNDESEDEFIIFGEAGPNETPEVSEGEDTASDGSSDLGDQSIETEDPGSAPVEEPEPEVDVGDTSITDAEIEAIPTTSPEPVESEDIGDTAISAVELDLGSNSIIDVIPIAPRDASSAIDGDADARIVNDPSEDVGAMEVDVPEPTTEDLGSAYVDGLGDMGESVEMDGSDDFFGENKKSKICGEGKKGLEDAIKNCNNTVSLSDLDDDDDDEDDDDDDDKKEKVKKIIKSITEAISFGDDTGGEQQQQDAGGGDQNTATDTPPDIENPDAGNSAENGITSAVREKVSEADNPDPASASLDAGMDDMGSASISKEDIMKRVTGISKTLDDLKMELVKGQ